MGCIWAWEQLRCNIPNVFGFVNRSTMFPALTGIDISHDSRTSEEKTIHSAEHAYITWVYVGKFSKENYERCIYIIVFFIYLLQNSEM